MVSDCGNEINSVKFIVWVYDNDNGCADDGFLELAAAPGTIPRYLNRKVRFSGYHEMKCKMEAMIKELRKYEEWHQYDRLGFEFYCPKCNTAFTRDQANVQSHGAGVNLKCPDCGFGKIKTLPGF